MDRNRRLVNYSLLALTGTGAYYAIGTMFQSLEPPKKALLDAATFIDTNALPLNEIFYMTWQKKATVYPQKRRFYGARQKTRHQNRGVLLHPNGGHLYSFGLCSKV